MNNLSTTNKKIMIKKINKPHQKNLKIFMVLNNKNYFI